MKKLPLFCGAGTAIITPFTKDGKIDFDSFERLIELQLKARIKALIVCGTTGEGSTLTKEERISITEFAKEKAKNDCKIITGTGCNNTVKALEFTIDAVQAGADGILAVTPYYNKTTQKGTVKYYKEICGVTEKPVIAYNVPSRTGLNILPSTAEELMRITNLCGIKEASGNMAQITETAFLCGEGLPIYSGSDEINIPVFSVGGIGVISVLSNAVPEKVNSMCESCLKGDFEKAKIIQLELYPLIKQLFSCVNPIPIKKHLYEKGLTEYYLRPPLYAE